MLRLKKIFAGNQSQIDPRIFYPLITPDKPWITGSNRRLYKGGRYGLGNETWECGDVSPLSKRRHVAALQNSRFNLTTDFTDKYRMWFPSPRRAEALREGGSVAFYPDRICGICG